MAHATAQERPKNAPEPGERRRAGPLRKAVTKLSSYIHRGGAQLKQQEDDKLEKAKDGLRDLYQRPATGRTTPLGRKVEKPREGSAGGPSGQKVGVDHDKKHANK
jgi:hypothetical protein